MKKKSHNNHHAARITGIIALVLIAAMLFGAMSNVIQEAATAATEAYAAEQKRITAVATANQLPSTDTVTTTTTTTLSEEEKAAIMAYQPVSYLLVDASGSVSGNYCLQATSRYDQQKQFTDYLGQMNGDSAIGTSIVTVLDAGCCDLGVVTDAKSEPIEELDNMRGRFYKNVKVTIFYTSNTDPKDLDRLVEMMKSILDPDTCSLYVVDPDGNEMYVYQSYRDLAEVLENIEVSKTETKEVPVPASVQTKEANNWDRYMETFRVYYPMAVLVIIFVLAMRLLAWWIYKIAIQQDCQCEGPADEKAPVCSKCCSKCCSKRKECFGKGSCKGCTVAHDASAASAAPASAAASAAAPASHASVAARNADDVLRPALVVDGVHSEVDRQRYAGAVSGLASDAAGIYTFNNEDCCKLETITDIGCSPSETSSDFNLMLWKMHARGHRHLNIVTRNLSDIGELNPHMTFDSITLWVPEDVDVCRDVREKLNALLTGGNTCQVYHMEKSA